MGTQYLLFVEKKNSLFVLCTVEISSLDSFFDFSKTKQISFRLFFLPKCCKNKFLCVKILLRKFSPKKSDKNRFSFREDLPFLIFSILFLSRRAFLQTKKPDSLYFSLYCFCLICSLFRVVSLCLLSLLLLF